MNNPIKVGGFSLGVISTFLSSALPATDKNLLVPAVILFFISWILESLPEWIEKAMGKERYFKFSDSIPNQERENKVKIKIFLVKKINQIVQNKIPLYLLVGGLVLAVFSFH